MFEGMGEGQARGRILEMVREYCRAYRGGAGWEPGEPLRYAAPCYGGEELSRGADALLEGALTAGRYTQEFEEGLAGYLGVGHCSLANSGSSANLLAFAALTSPQLGERRVRRGDEVITSACAFPTTVAPIVQNGAVPVFVDIRVPYYNVDAAQLEGALTSRTRAVMLAHTLGSPFDIRGVKSFCDRHGLWLIEDNCDALGAEYDMGDGPRRTGSFGHIGTSSFYPAHHISMGEGGAVYTDDPLLHRCVRSLRDWGRDCQCAPGQDGRCGRRFGGRHGSLPAGHDHKYVYSHLGYNLKATEVQAAIGCAQLGRLEGFVRRRRENAEYLMGALRPLEERGALRLPLEEEGASASWFGLPIACPGEAARDRAVMLLEGRGVQTRPLFAGNLSRHPCLEGREAAWRAPGGLPETDRAMGVAFWVGVHPGMTQGMLDYVAQAIGDALG